MSEKTGRLECAGIKSLGFYERFEWWRCVDCRTEYPRRPGEPTTCNGQIIDLCPWCRPDSKPWTKGRGL